MNDAHTPTDDDATDGEPMLSSDLKALINSCNDVEEFRTLLQNRGLWLNRHAAESAFYALQSDRSVSLSDEELDGVVGGVTMQNDQLSFLEELLLHL